MINIFADNASIHHNPELKREMRDYCNLLYNLPYSP